MTDDHAQEASAASAAKGGAAVSGSKGGARWFGGAATNAATWAFAFLVLRIFAVSGYSWDTAFWVSTTLGVGDGLLLVLGSLMAGHVLVAVLLMGVLPLLIAAYLWGPRIHRPVVLLAGSLATVALVALTMSFSAWWLPVATAAIFGAFALVHRMARERRLRRVVMKVMVRAGAVTAGAVLVAAAVVQTPWVPLEHIETTDGEVAGYVLSVDSGYLNVLTEDQDFVVLMTSDVVARR